MAAETQVVTPHLVVSDAAAALEFYKKALGATETMRMPAEDGKRLMHSEIVGQRRDGFSSWTTFPNIAPSIRARAMSARPICSAAPR